MADEITLHEVESLNIAILDFYHNYFYSVNNMLIANTSGLIFYFDPFQ